MYSIETHNFFNNKKQPSDANPRIIYVCDTRCTLVSSTFVIWKRKASMIMLSRPLFVLLSFLIWSLYRLPFDLLLLIIRLAFWNFSYIIKRSNSANFYNINQKWDEASLTGQHFMFRGIYNTKNTRFMRKLW